MFITSEAGALAGGAVPVASGDEVVAGVAELLN
jgi:hypothetical protein